MVVLALIVLEVKIIENVTEASLIGVHDISVFPISAILLTEGKLAHSCNSHSITEVHRNFTKQSQHDSRRIMKFNNFNYSTSRLIFVFTVNAVCVSK